MVKLNSELAEAAVLGGGIFGGGGGGCFIATAAYGSPMADKVLLLKVFRDRILKNYQLGRSFIRIYYKLSPPVADLIENSAFLKAVVRCFLIPLIGFAWLALNFGETSIFLFLFTLCTLLLEFIIFKNSFRKIVANRR